MAATLMPGARELVAELDRRGIPQAILTRNSREMTDLALRPAGVLILAGPHSRRRASETRPGGAALHLPDWNVDVADVIFVGDFQFDIIWPVAAPEFRTVLYAPGDRPDYADEADFVVRHLSEICLLVDGQPQPD